MCDGPFRRILVAVDGSDPARRAAQLAAELAAASCASLLLLHVRPHVGEYLGEPYYQQLLDRVSGEAEDLLATVRAANSGSSILSFLATFAASFWQFRPGSDLARARSYRPEIRHHRYEMTSSG